MFLIRGAVSTTPRPIMEFDRLELADGVGSYYDPAVREDYAG